MTERYSHSLSAQQLSSHSVLLVIFGGRTSRVSVNLSHTVLIELSEHYQCIVHAVQHRLSFRNRSEGAKRLFFIKWGATKGLDIKNNTTSIKGEPE